MCDLQDLDEEEQYVRLRDDNERRYPLCPSCEILVKTTLAQEERRMKALLVNNSVRKSKTEILSDRQPASTTSPVWRVAGMMLPLAGLTIQLSYALGHLTALLGVPTECPPRLDLFAASSACTDGLASLSWKQVFCSCLGDLHPVIIVLSCSLVLFKLLAFHQLTSRFFVS